MPPIPQTAEGRREMWRDITCRQRNSPLYQNARLFARLLQVMKSHGEA